jgi:hypothetical protein
MEKATIFFKRLPKRTQNHQKGLQDRGEGLEYSVGNPSNIVFSEPLPGVLELEEVALESTGEERSARTSQSLGDRLIVVDFCALAVDNRSNSYTLRPLTPLGYLISPLTAEAMYESELLNVLPSFNLIVGH